MLNLSDEARNHLCPRAMAALEGCGSALIRELPFRGSWLLVGRKGAPPGSVPEQLFWGVCHILF